MTARARALQRGLGLPARLWHLSRPGCTTTLTVQRRLPLVALLAAALWLIIQPSSMALTATAALAALILFAFLWARAMAAGVGARRMLRSSAVQVGDALEEVVTLENRSFLPVVWAEYVDRSTLPGYSLASARTAGPGSAETWDAETICTRRGVFTLGPWELLLGEPLGIFQARQVYDQRVELLVYPPLATLPPDLRPRSKKVGDRQRLRQALAAETTHANSTRPYTRGDPLRHVHWRTTARQRRLFVKQFEPEASSSIWLIPDLDPGVHAGSGAESSFETMVVLLASLASQLLNERLAVGLLAGTGPRQTVLPRFGGAHLWSILHALARVQPVPDRSLAATLMLARTLITARDSLVVVTPAVDCAWLGALAQLTRGPRSGAEVVLLDPASFGGAPGVERCKTLLAERGVTAHVVRRQDVRPIAGAYGAVRRWEFVTLATGRVLVRQTPRWAGPAEQAGHR